MAAALRSATRPAPALLIAATAVIVSACQMSFSTGGLDYDKLETAITDELNTTYESVGQQVSSLECPRESPSPGKGDSLICTAEVGDQQVRVEATVTDEDYNVDFVTLDTLYDLSQTGAVLSEEISAQLGFPVTVTCGEGLRAVEVGSTLDCMAADELGAERVVQITASPVGEDDQWELLE
ncbi:DUF4333 domain-containing protein [Mycobacterium sp. SMC-4]|uniref:DUF4333 domain-containing protein n=1 Tax=Mycobacterium sp. SMC-4 TaxID=2857059 RepID=UPI0021B27586|nr:DUF4333 domain-containing protein [Mycobacterium sp. SMC-4]UXA17966.1 DUF4333 domain-containing protein [Mycobacterium sp. SMC-4]